MINIEQIRNFYPPVLSNNPSFFQYLLKEYLQLTILDFLSTTAFIRKIVFIGGTNLRLVKGIDRFSEDLDFDSKNFSKEEFMDMTDQVLVFLRRSGWHVEARDQTNIKLRAYRRSIHFPELLFDLGISGHKEKRFMIKIESEDQQIDYKPIMAKISACGFFINFPVPDDKVLCSMKIQALLNRQKGRDFYDVMFLLGQSSPDYDLLESKMGIRNLAELKVSITNMLKKINLAHKSRDFEHLVFDKIKSRQILSFGDFIENYGP
ncbi:nucleotidyl transferase AbiEii/AbiGii toxin family protein [Bacteroidota bacterium]